MGSSSGSAGQSTGQATSGFTNAGNNSSSQSTAAPSNASTPAQFQAASYPELNLANQLASGYQQVFGRDADAGGLNYWTGRLGGQNLSQGEVNRYLLGGAQGEDVKGGSDYALSLTGGRPQPGKAFYQPIYSPTYSNYSMNQGFYSPGYDVFGGGGGFYNPFSYNSSPIMPFGMPNTPFNPGGPAGPGPSGDVSAPPPSISQSIGRLGGILNRGFEGARGRLGNYIEFAEGGEVDKDEDDDDDKGIAGALRK